MPVESVERRGVLGRAGLVVTVTGTGGTFEAEALDAAAFELGTQSVALDMPVESVGGKLVVRVRVAPAAPAPPAWDDAHDVGDEGGAL